MVYFWGFIYEYSKFLIEDLLYMVYVWGFVYEYRIYKVNIVDFNKY